MFVPTNDVLSTTQTKKGSRAQCHICPRECLLSSGEIGVCGGRKNAQGKCVPVVRDYYPALMIDPIEKKPFYHFYPGKQVLSIGALGCSLKCGFCYNKELSCPESYPEDQDSRAVDKKMVELLMSDSDIIGIAFSFTEPSVWIETYMKYMAMATVFRKKVLLKTNGYINPQLFMEMFILNPLHAVNLDIKTMNPETFRTVCDGDLSVVLHNAEFLGEDKREYHDPIHLEVSHLMIPGVTDKESEFRELVTFIESKLGNDTPLHIATYHPVPWFPQAPSATPEETVKRFYKIAKDRLKYVYLEHTLYPECAATVCPKCGQKAIQRDDFEVTISKRCKHCLDMVWPPYKL